MPPWASLLGLGFLLGMRHAADADHVVAVSTIVTREKRMGTACWLGIAWGLGHTLTIFLVGVAIIFFKVVIPHRVGLSFEFVVGLMLMVLGILNIMGRGIGALGTVEHEHAHDHGDAHHHHHDPNDVGASHIHPHSHPLTLGWLESPEHSQIWRSLLVGLVHGLAGSAAAALLVLATVSNPATGLAYLLVFGLGTIAGMLIVSGTMEASFVMLLRGRSDFGRALRLGTGVLSTAFGSWIVYRTCFIDGLF